MYLSELTLDESFVASYQLHSISRPVIHFPVQAGDSESDIAIEVNASGSTWCGVFRSGSEGSFGLFTCPNPDELCVLAGGTISILNVTRAITHAAMNYEFVRSVTPVVERSLLVLATDTDLIGYGIREEWRSGQICLDELKVDGNDDRYLYLTCWDPRFAERQRFKVDLTTGKPVDYKMP